MVREILAGTQHVTVTYRSDPGRIRLCPDPGGSLGGLPGAGETEGVIQESSVVVLTAGANAEDPETQSLGCHSISSMHTWFGCSKYRES